MPAVAEGGQSPCRGTIAALHVFWEVWGIVKAWHEKRPAPWRDGPQAAEAA